MQYFSSSESTKWSSFIILHCFYYWESDLKCVRELGIVPELQLEYDRLYAQASDLEETVRNTSPDAFTLQTALDYLNRFTYMPKDIPQQFPWDEIHHLPEPVMVFLSRLKTILSDIRTGHDDALNDLKNFLRDISPLIAIVHRFFDGIADPKIIDIKTKTESIPWYVSGEITEVNAREVHVIIERSGHNDEAYCISRKDFPEKEPRVGQLFFGAIPKFDLDKIMNIRFIPEHNESAEEILSALFGKETYKRASAQWETIQP
ncbi:MAG: hypothetical protein ACM3SY_01710 [Candidatus Omnitrophota bacterium]